MIKFIINALKSIVLANKLDRENQQALTVKVKAIQDFFTNTVHILFVKLNKLHGLTDDIITLARLKEFA